MSKIPQGEWSAIAARYQNGESISKIARSYGCTPPAIHYILKRNSQRPAGALGRPQSPHPVEAGPQLVRAKLRLPAAAPVADKPAEEVAAPPAVDTAATPLTIARQPLVPPAAPAPKTPSAAFPGLDSELRLRSEAAIELFRSSFNAALVEGSPVVRERLRQAANDLMRVAARTTIVLDRLNAHAEQSARAHDYPRSAHAGDALGKFP